MKIKVSEATPLQLNWMVAKCEQGGVLPEDFNPRYALPYSTDWSDGGPIIERERFYLQPGPVWYAMRSDVNQPMLTRQSGPTPLIASMRCYVASKLGEEVDIPEELIGSNS